MESIENKKSLLLKANALANKWLAEKEITRHDPKAYARASQNYDQAERAFRRIRFGIGHQDDKAATITIT